MNKKVDFDYREVMMILGVYGTGGTGREVAEIAEQINYNERKWERIIFIDDTKPIGSINGISTFPFSYIIDNYTVKDIEIVIALGEPYYRYLLNEKVSNVGYHLASIIHPDASISPSAKVGSGVIIKKGAIISSNSMVMSNVCVQAYAIIGHDAFVGENCQISSFVTIAGNCKIGSNVYIGLNSSVKERIIIEDNVIVSMSSSVVRDVSEGLIVVGNPARPIKKNEDRIVFHK